jgi:hypothetical protein
VAAGVVSEHYVFFGIDGQSGTSLIRRVGKPNGGLSQTFSTSGPPLNLATIAGDTVFWATGTGRTIESLGPKDETARTLYTASSFLANAETVAALDRFGRSVVLWPIAGGPARTSPLLQGQPSGIAIDESCVYVTTDQPGFVGVLPIDG